MNTFCEMSSSPRRTRRVSASDSPCVLSHLAAIISCESLNLAALLGLLKSIEQEEEKHKPYSSISFHRMYLSICFEESTPHKIVNLSFTIKNYTFKLTVVWGSRLS